MQDLITVRVARKTSEARDICSLELVSAAGDTLPAFSAGAHIDVLLPSGIMRQYSLMNRLRHGASYEIAVLHEPASRGGSRGIHEQVSEGDTLQISAPRNHFPLSDEASASLLLAGGIGITPLLCMAESLDESGRIFALHYCVRTGGRAAFMSRLRAAPFAERVEVHLDDGPAEQVFDMAAVIAAQPTGCHLYVCGPTGFIEAAKATAGRLGWGAERIHVEYFGAVVEAKADDASFEVEIASSGEIFVVPPHATVADILLDAGIDLPVSCEQGVCGTCVTRILSGVPDHRDQYLTESERAANDQFTPCCSRASSSRLVLDL